MADGDVLEIRFNVYRGFADLGILPRTPSDLVFLVTSCPGGVARSAEAADFSRT